MAEANPATERDTYVLNAVFKDFFVQINPFYEIAEWSLFTTFFLASVYVIKKLGKMFSIYSLSIIVAANICFLARCIVY